MKVVPQELVDLIFQQLKIEPSVLVELPESASEFEMQETSIEQNFDDSIDVEDVEED